MKPPNWKRATKLLRRDGAIHRNCMECGKRIPEGAGFEWAVGAWTCVGECTDRIRENSEAQAERQNDDMNFYSAQAWDSGYEKGYREAEREWRE